MSESAQKSEPQEIEAVTSDISIKAEEAAVDDIKKSIEEAAEQKLDATTVETTENDDDNSLFDESENEEEITEEVKETPEVVVEPKQPEPKLDDEDKDLFDTDSESEDEPEQKASKPIEDQSHRDDHDSSYQQENYTQEYVSVSNQENLADSEVEKNPMDEVLASIKTSKLRRGNKMTEEEKEEIVHDLLLRMDKASTDDLLLRRQGKLALNKLQLLDEVLKTLSRTVLQTTFLERNLLQVMGQWLRPIKNHRNQVELPNLGLRTKLYGMVDKFPIDVEHLSRAKFGKIIAYLRDSKLETKENRDHLGKMVQKWARTIFGNTDDWKMLEHAQSTQRPVIRNKVTKKRKKSALSELSEAPGKKRDSRYRAQIPRQREFNFTARITGLDQSGKSPVKTGRAAKLEKALRDSKKAAK